MIVVLDYGSQYTRLIAKQIRLSKVYCLVKNPRLSLDDLKALKPSAVILSGGPNSVYEAGAPALPHGFLEWQKGSGVPVLGICYGLQLLVHEMGGEVKPGTHREYGRMPVEVVEHSDFWGTQPGTSRTMWMSHGDAATRLPEGFKLTAKSQSGAVASIEHPSRKLFGLQFHPEVTHSDGGVELIRNFLFKVSGLKPTWESQGIIETQIAAIRAKVGPNDHVICALSGGVDSTVAAKLVHDAIGDRLHCVFVDHGLLRFDEANRVMKMLGDQMKLPVECVDASERFLAQLAGVTDPEIKRKRIGAEFIGVFRDYAAALEKKIGKKAKYLVQGTLYSDVIESSASGHAGDGQLAASIKSHHNVGGLPKDLGFELIEPFRDLFKDEVREVGKTMGIPRDFVARHPFPGPGLGVRILGEVTRARADLLRKCDEIFIQMIRDEGLYDQIWQAFAALLPVRSVGVQGDGRTHDEVIALRAVNSVDGMTAEWFPFDPRFLARVSARICNEVRGVNRVVYDISTKPPATIEWE